MAISLNNPQDYTGAPDATPIEVSYSVSGLQPGRVLCVAARLQTSGGSLSAVSVSYGGQSMTTGYGVEDIVSSYFIFSYLFSPPTGANNISVAYTTSSRNAAYLISAFTLTGVRQYGGLRDSKTTTGASGTSAAVPALAGVMTGDFSVMALGLRTSGGDQNIAWGSGQTEIADLYRDNLGFQLNLGTSYELSEANLSASWTASALGYAAWGGAFIPEEGGGWWAFL